MTYQKGHKKMGGRTKGVPNKITMDLINTLIANGYDPAAMHLNLLRKALSKCKAYEELQKDYYANDMLEAAIRANADLMRYCYPTRKAVEHSGPNGEELKFQSFTDIIIAIGERERKKLPDNTGNS